MNQIEWVALTDIGHIRATNQDRLLSRRIDDSLQLFAVFDGLGGQPGGEEAAETALKVVESFAPVGTDYRVELQQLLHQANAAVIDRGNKEPDLYNMGTTATLLLIAEEQAYWAHIGDSRLYRVHDNALIMVTEDHNIAWELFVQGEISVEQRQNHKFRHFLTQCLGEDDIEPASGSFTLTAGDTLLLCTDGVHGFLREETISGIVNGGDPLEKRAERLLAAALAAGGEDNITLILLQFC